MEIKYNKNDFYENTKFNTIQSIFDNEKGLYVADFETSKINSTDNDVFVYATALMDVNERQDRCYHTDNIEDFIHNISNLPYLESEIYFHNLSFDVVLILLKKVLTK